MDGGTRLTADRADAAHRLHRVRQHWHIEHRSHSVRDGTGGEDPSQGRGGAIPRVITTFRNTASARIRLTGTTQYAATTPRFAAKPPAPSPSSPSLSSTK